MSPSFGTDLFTAGIFHLLLVHLLSATAPFILANVNQLGTHFRIVNGTATKITKYPFLVSVQEWTEVSKRHLCGGTFISDIWILTAAHCVMEIEPRHSMIRAESSYNDRGGILLRIAQTALHPKMSQQEMGIDYDFGLIKLRNKFSRAQTVTLPSRPSRFRPDELCHVAGWGLTKGTGARVQLREVQVPIVKQSVCRTAYVYFSNVTSRMMCAGYAEGQRDACDGDSGGPLLCRGMQVGVTSWAVGCAKPNRYGVYATVSEGRGWIKTVTGI